MPAWMLGFQYNGDTPGARLLRTRLAKNTTIVDLAKITGLGKPTLYNLETDKITARPPCLRILASVLDVPIFYLGKYEDLPEETLGQRIKKARLYHDLTKVELARAIGSDVKTLRSWECDLHKPLSKYMDLLEKYLIVLSSPE